jgi:predicted SAM-dependent methyltransferase
MKIHLGCGHSYKENYINVDNSPYIKADMIWDLNKFPYPFEDNSANEIVCRNTMEHLENIVGFMEEVHRILKPKGVFKFRVPLAFTYADAVDTTHIQHFVPKVFKMFMSGFKSYKITDIKFGGRIWITPPIFHKLKFPKELYLMNSFINNMFTGLEGELSKIEK